MAERNASPLGFFSRNYMLWLFTITSILFVLSWLSVLRSTGRPRFIDHSLLPNSKPFAVTDKSNSESQNPRDIEPSIEIEGEEPEQRNTMKCSSDNPSSNDPSSIHPILKVYMYDLPAEFHFGLLNWTPQGESVWPDIRTQIPSYRGGLNLQHSIEYWLTLDLLSSEFPENQNSRAAIRVHNSSEADVVFVPFFSSASYNHFIKLRPHGKRNRGNKLLQDKLVKFLTGQAEWNLSEGRDHIIMAHHPNSMLDARMKLSPSIFILSDFGRYPPHVANVGKDVIAPYKHVIKRFANDTSDFDSRPTLLYFQGAIYRKDGGFIRQELYYILRDEKDVHFSFGNAQGDGINKASRGMHSSKFCLNIAGDTPSSNRLFDAIASHCVPVIISDEIELPYEDVLDYSEFCIFVRTSDALKDKFLITLIRSIKKDEWTRMWRRLQEVENFFEFQYPSKEGDAVQMIWQAIARKVPSIRLKLHRSRRFARTSDGKERVMTSMAVPKNFW